MNILYHTVVTSRRHREMGYCEESDFGGIELFQPEENEHELIVSFKGYSSDPVTEFVLINFFDSGKDMVYRKVTKAVGLPHQSRDAQDAMNYVFGENKAIQEMCRIRESMEYSFSCVANHRFVLIGRTLYQEYCKPEDLCIGVSGNILFSHWTSITIESRLRNMAYYPLSKENLKAVVKDRKKKWEDAKIEGRGDGHSLFTKPTQVKWGNGFHVELFFKRNAEEFEL